MLLFLQGANYLVPTAISFVLIAVIAFAYHEFAHAIVADRLGDPTPRQHGRITLNPIPHLDRTGLIMLMIIGFGYAFTPINPRYFRGNPRTSHAIVSIAGPVMNLLIAFAMGLPVRLGLVSIQEPSQFLPSLYSFLAFGVYFNLLLFAFNMIPIPPLDGFTILLGILPPDLAYRLQGLYRYSQMIFLAVFFLLPVVGINIAFEIIGPVISFFFPLFLGPFAPLIL
ncbi:site-2 protease family protein [Candidatus Leptofilum sp.]|uniref:site-2 protease family protein n=1 Tax=Candidatus Leptofilum sp. TaxID=3241576 RepID=UPI003B5B4719